MSKLLEINVKLSSVAYHCYHHTVQQSYRPISQDLFAWKIKAIRMEICFLQDKICGPKY